ncbi:MAG: MerR family transcriptional regulator [Chloroflexi bacterium]|nr:MerR family transcriptional regulator [Chloroflexota bacterium]
MGNEGLQQPALSSKTMFKIGQFSKLSQVSVKTLRYYDDIGLLPSAEVDRFSGYRYYTAEQLLRLNRIRALKHLGLSLDQIRQILDAGLSSTELRGMLRLKQAEVEKQLVAQQSQLQQLDTWLSQIELEGSMPTYEFIIKEVPQLRIASVRHTIPNYAAQGPLWEELETYLEEQHIKRLAPCFVIDHNDEFKEKDVDIEACEVVDWPTGDYGKVQVRELPAATVVSMIHKGPYTSLVEAYGALMAWIANSSYRICGPNREIYIRNPSEDIDPSDYVTELQFPVQKVS